ncbi:MAG: glycosyltransferase family 4 protein [Methylocystis sp.]|nr:glycosyltransferase family 4 protein [Methylocystis sp.]
MNTANGGAGALRIVHVLRAPVGGLFRHVLDLSYGQIARGHQVGLIADSLTGGARAEAQLAELAPKLALGVMRIPMRRLPHPSDLSALAEVSRRLAALAPDVVHGHGSKGGFYARFSCLMRGRSEAIRAYTPHGGSLNYRPGSWTHRLFMLVEKLLAYQTDILLFESAYIANRYRTYVGEPYGLARVVRNGVGPEEFAPVTPVAEAADFVYVGEFRSAKGLDTLIDAMGLIAARLNRKPNIVLVGAGPEQSALRDRAEKRGVAAQLKFKPPTPAREAFALGKIMVLPSRAESLPYIALEAVGARLPLVATNVGGMTEIFGPHSGQLIACDDANLLSEALVGALNEDPAAQRAKATELADYVASRFSLSHMVDQIISGYREAIALRCGRGTEAIDVASSFLDGRRQ